MDFFSHALLGFVLGRALQLDKKVRYALIISCVFPDFDSVSLLAGWEVFSVAHRGPTHSFLGLILGSVVIAGVYAVIERPSLKEYRFVLLLCLAGSFSHIFLDILTPWSMAVWWPFSSVRIAYNVTFFFDPLFFGIILLASVGIILAKNSKKIQMITVCALFLIGLNFSFRYYEMGSAVDTVPVDHTLSEVVPFPTVRPDKWLVSVVIPFNNGFIYDIYGVNSLSSTVLTKKTVETPYVNSEVCEPPLDSPEKAIGYSKKDKKVQAFIERSFLPAVRATFNGDVWVIYWFDAYNELSGGMSEGISITIDSSGTVLEIRSGGFH